MNINQLAANSHYLTAWLEAYVVGRFSGILHVDAVEKEGGFQAPERDADATWHSPESEPEDDDPSVGSIQFEWWQEGDTILGIRMATDPVMGIDHFTWYRIPVEDMEKAEERA